MGIAGLGRLFCPSQRLNSIVLDAPPISVHPGQRQNGWNIARIRRLLVPGEGQLRRWRTALALLRRDAEVERRRNIALFGGELEPEQRLLEILRYALAVKIEIAEKGLRLSVAI